MNLVATAELAAVRIAVIKRPSISASGTPVDLHMDFHRSGLDGLADTGIFKKKEKP